MMVDCRVQNPYLCGLTVRVYGHKKRGGALSAFEDNLFAIDEHLSIAISAEGRFFPAEACKTSYCAV